MDKRRQNLRLFLPPEYVVRREGNSFTLFVSPHLGGGTLLGPGRGGTCQVQPGGGSCQVHPGGGYPARSSWGGGGYLPGPARRGGVPARSSWGGYLPGPARGGTLPGGGGYLVRTTEGVLTTQRAVCLLRSRRRTFLFHLKT